MFFGVCNTRINLIEFSATKKSCQIFTFGVGCNKTPCSGAGRCSSAAGEMTGTPSGVAVMNPGGKNGGLAAKGNMPPPGTRVPVPGNSVLSFRYMATCRRIVELRGPLSCCTAKTIK